MVSPGDLISLFPAVCEAGMPIAPDLSDAPPSHIPEMTYGLSRLCRSKCRVTEERLSGGDLSAQPEGSVGTHLLQRLTPTHGRDGVNWCEPSRLFSSASGWR